MRRRHVEAPSLRDSTLHRPPSPAGAWRSSLLTKSARTEGELAFEEYLANAGLEGTYEEPTDRTARRPDYRVTLGGETLVFEVKQFDPTGQPVSGFGHFDPYGPLRKRIEKAREKFKGLKGFAACSLVLYNNHRPLIFLDPKTIFGAMLGDVGIVFPFDPDRRMGDFSRARQEFLGGGKMVRYDRNGLPLAAQNTTISAIVVVESLPLGRRRFNAEIERHPQLEELSIEEILDTQRRFPGFSATVPRVRVFENPLALKELDSSFGAGPWDERFGLAPSTDRLVRLFVGEELKKLEREEAVAGIDVDPWKE